MKKRVLIISYYYYPIQRSVSYRLRIWADYLSQLGWEPIILTRHWNEDTQDSLEENNTPPSKEIDSEIGCLIYRTPYKQFLKKIVDFCNQFSHQKINFRILNFFLLNFFFYPDSYLGWYRYAYKTGLSIIKKNPISVIYSIGPPWTDHWISSKLSKATGVPWVADYRDKWSQRAPSKKRKIWIIHRIVSRIIEKRICGRAFSATHASRPWAINLNRLIGIKVYPVIYGIDEKDFANLNRYRPSKKIFTISYVGTLHYTQKLDTFFKGFKKFVISNNVPVESCRLKFIGSEGIRDVSRKYKSVESYIDIIPYLPREEAMKYMLQSHVLLLFLIEDNGWYPMKVFEYLMTGNQILATPNDNGVIKELLDKSNAGVALETAEEVANWLKNKWKEFQSYGYLFANINKKVLEEFNRKKQVQQLTEVLDRVSI